MPSQYEKPGVRFAYPENWELIEGDTGPEAGDETLVEVTLRSPGAAFWSLTVYPGERDTAGMLAEVVKAMQAEYPDLEQEEAAHLPGAEALAGPSLMGAELRFVCLDFTNTAQAYVYHHSGATHLLLLQAEDREWDEVEPVLRAVTLSLLSDIDLSE